ncbi:MAG TPA: PPOX class F420-dependent oxidoreductase [Acidimicrobiales bacterium]
MPAALPDSHRDLLEAPGVAVLSTLGPDGWPQSTAVWYLLDGDVVRLSLSTGRQKYRNVMRHPHATLFLLDPANPYRTLEIRADVTVNDDPGLTLMERVVTRYGMQLSDFEGQLEGRVAVTLTPHHVVASG